jgi:O-antigen/teichoic acid export membrane protein
LTAARRLFHNFILLFAGNVSGQVMFFIGGLYLARVLGPAGYGLWSFAQAWQLYLLRAGEFGLEVVGIRELVRQPDQSRTSIPTIVLLRVAIASILYLLTLAFALADLMPYKAGSIVLLFSVSVLTSAFTVEWIYEARQRIPAVSISRFIKGLLFVPGVLIFVRGISDLSTSVIIYVLSLSLPVLFLFCLVTFDYGFHVSLIKFTDVIATLRKAAPIGLAAILSHYSLFIGAITVGYVLSRTELGLFSAAQRVVVMPWIHVFASFQRVLLPPLAKWFHESPERYLLFIERFFRLAVVSSIAVGIAGTFYGPSIMSLLYSAAYDSAGVVFLILLWAFVIAAVRLIFEIGLIAAEKQKRYLTGMALLAVVYSVATPILAFKFGINGAAWASVIAEGSYFIFLVFSFPQLEMKSLVNHMWKPAFGGICAMAVGWLARPLHSPAWGVFSMAIYIAFLLLSRAFSAEDARLILSLVGRGGTAPVS